MEKVLRYSIEYDSARENRVKIKDPIYPKAGVDITTIITIQLGINIIEIEQ